jgi:hypothetical protein
MYGLLRYPQTFGFAGVMSPAVCFNSCALLGYLLEAPYVPGRVYLDVDPVEDTGTFAYTRALRALLEAKGCKPGSDLFYVEEANKGYCETAWAYRVRHALQLLLDSGRPRSLQPDWPAFATMRSPDSGPTAIQN